MYEIAGLSKVRKCFVTITQFIDNYFDNQLNVSVILLSRNTKSYYLFPAFLN